MQLIEPYQPRSFKFQRLIGPPGWRIKLYTIRYAGEEADPALVAAALPHLEGRVGQSAPGTSHYGVGFAAVHHGRSGNFAFVDWWADENELHHHLYLSTLERPDRFAYVTPTGLIACAWDLHLVSFERDAWYATVLANPAGPDLDAYLARRLDGIA